jgi:hypothetical protein
LSDLRFRRSGGETGPLPADEDPTTEEMRAVQAARAEEEERQAEEADQPADARAHERRADKAAYLRDRLAEAERSEADDG